MAGIEGVIGEFSEMIEVVQATQFKGESSSAHEGQTLTGTSNGGTALPSDGDQAPCEGCDHEVGEANVSPTYPRVLQTAVF